MGLCQSVKSVEDRPSTPAGKTLLENLHLGLRQDERAV